MRPQAMLLVQVLSQEHWSPVSYWLTRLEMTLRVSSSMPSPCFPAVMKEQSSEYGGAMNLMNIQLQSGWILLIPLRVAMVLSVVTQHSQLKGTAYSVWMCTKKLRSELPYFLSICSAIQTSLALTSSLQKALADSTKLLKLSSISRLTPGPVQLLKRSCEGEATNTLSSIVKVSAVARSRQTTMTLFICIDRYMISQLYLIFDISQDVVILVIYIIITMTQLRRFIPLRTFIYDRLYHPSYGYFCRNDFQVGELKQPLNFKQFIGYDDYQHELNKNYPSNAWLTPSEIFKPYYGMIVARYLQQAYQRQQIKYGKHRLRIVEAGAGTGSAAQSILYYFSNYQREILPELEYTVVEISPALSRRVESRLKQAYPRLFSKGQIKVLNDDISNYKQEEPCFALFFEVLDNLPHDKVLWNSQKKVYDQFVTVDPDTLEEAALPIEQDQLVKDCLRLYNSTERQQPIAASLLERAAGWVVGRMAGKSVIPSQDLFLPTYLLRLLRRFSKNVPQAHLVVSDFDHLISPVPGINAPIVSRKGFNSDEKQDFKSYLVKRGEADIFFPVDFSLLQRMHEDVLKGKAQVVKSHQFMGQFSEQAWAQTRSRFNPIRQDFANTSVLVSQISQSKTN